ncbi:methylmalonyl-CoA mutase [bacterium]|nr:methylmalonyl-CoA mutase [bacterium]
MSKKKERKEKFVTPSGLEIKRIYKPEDLSQFDPSQQLGESGEYPFTRGVYSTMYRGKLWTMRQYAGFGTAEESNQRYRYLLSQGQTGLSVAFDLPTQLGFDSDQSQAQGEVGKVGVSIDTLQDMEVLFDRIPLDEVSVSMTINATAAVILAMYLALARKRNISWDKLSGTIQNDLLKEYIARGTYIYPPHPSLKIITDLLSFCHSQVPHWNTMSISGYHIREAGATAVQELAFTLANAATYIQAALDAGLEVDQFAPRLSFFLSAHNNFFEEVAKFRAARRLWSHLVREKFQAKNPRSWKFRFHTQTSGATLTSQQPENNVVRVALQALASVLGGTQSLHTNSRDEALSLPSQESARIALRTQQIIAHESGVPDTVDPLGGSYFLETLTNRVEQEVKRYLKKIEDMGGMLQAIQKGFIQKEIQESAYAYQKEVEKKNMIVVGVNQYRDEEEKTFFKLHYPPEEVEKSQVEKLQRIKNNRTEKEVQSKLHDLKKAAMEEENLLPPMIEAVESMATLGEISSVLKEVYGTFQETLYI